MKHLKRYIALICTLCLVLGALSGCGTNTTDLGTFELPTEFQNVKSGEVVSNNHFSMIWDANKAAVSFVSKKDGSVWSTASTKAKGTSEALKSSLYVECRDMEKTYTHYVSESCVPNGYFTSVKTDKGISVTYYFEESESEVTVDYYLEGEAFKVSVDPKKILCYSDKYITDVVPASFVCSAQVTEQGSKDSYFVIPSGSGALVYLGATNSTVAKNYVDDVYGADASIDKYEDKVSDIPITMPFYGVKTAQTGLCAIVEQGAGATTLNFSIPNEQGALASIFTSFAVAGFNKVYHEHSHRVQYNEQAEQNLEPLVIGYYAVDGAEASYTGIAKKYRKYLLDAGMEKSQDNSLLTVKLIGSYVEDDLFLGLPTTKNVALTSYADAKQIIKELNEFANGSLVVDMYGYGEGGINALKMAGNYKLTGVVGNKKALNDFVTYTSDSKIKTFFNFNTVTFSSSGAGFSAKSDTASNLNGITAPYRQFWFSTRDRYDVASGGVVYAMVARSQLAKAVSKTVKLSDKYNISGLVYDTLGNISYSDYDTDKNGNALYPLRNKMESDVAQIIADTKANSKTVMIDGALSYAAAAADIITGCPTASNKNNSFDVDVPLYQIVFQGTKANSAYSINHANNQRKQFLQAIETGSGLAFTLVGNYTGELRKQYMRGLNTSLYSDNKEKIAGYVAEGKEYLTSVAGATIKSHEIINANVRKTTFNNGVVVIVNYGEKAYKSEIGTVKANSFLYK